MSSISSDVPSRGGSTDYAVVKFAADSGGVYRFTTSGPGDYAKGATVEVFYDAGDPAKARVNVFLELWLGSLALGGRGGAGRAFVLSASGALGLPR